MGIPECAQRDRGAVAGSGLRFDHKQHQHSAPVPVRRSLHLLITPLKNAGRGLVRAPHFFCADSRSANCSQGFLWFKRRFSRYNSFMNRRTFLESSIAAAVLTSLPGKSFAATHQIAKVGLQLYTVRDVMGRDFEGTIAKVAAVGYQEVEFAGLYNHSAKDVRA